MIKRTTLFLMLSFESVKVKLKRERFPRCAGWSGWRHWVGTVFHAVLWVLFFVVASHLWMLTSRYQLLASFET